MDRMSGMSAGTTVTGTNTTNANENFAPMEMAIAA